LLDKFEKCPFRPEKHGTERPLQKRPALLAVGFVEAARFLGGQPFASSRIKLSHCPRAARREFSRASGYHCKKAKEIIHG
jgi:hypothetical protein